MKFGVREICDVVFKAKSSGDLGSYHYEVGQPVLYIDSAKTSTIEGAATTVYATGGRGNSRLIAWEGEKTLTFTVEDALLSPMGLAILTGAGLMKLEETEKTILVHMTSKLYMSNGTISFKDVLDAGVAIANDAPVFVMEMDVDGSLTGRMIYGFTPSLTEADGNGLQYAQLSGSDLKYGTGENAESVDNTTGYVFVDYYTSKSKTNVYEFEIDAGNFAGYYYVEASTLFRRQADGYDLPAEIIFPNVKVQSNFTFSMAPTGDPSTFTFTMDAMPGKVNTALGNKASKNVLCAIQIIEDKDAEQVDATSKDSIEDTAVTN